MRRSLVALLAVALLVVPALALAAVERGTYVDPKTGAYLVTNAAATSLKTLQIGCLNSGSQNGSNVIKKGVKLSPTGKFSFSGKSTLHQTTNKVITMKITGKVGKKATGTVTYSGSPKPCDDQTFSAKYYGVNPQG